MTDTSQCLAESVVLDFVQGRLTGSALAPVEAHIARCPECRQLVSLLARSSLAGYGPGSSGPPPSPFDPTLPSEVPAPPTPAPVPRSEGREKHREGAPVREGDLLAGKYRVESILGSGGMGVVVAATHETLQQKVALKFLKPSVCSEPGAVARFLREARAAVQIEGEHVAKVLDVGTLDDGSPYIVMEYLRGTDLEELLRRRGPLAVDEAIDCILQACEAVAEAHRLGIVHRDLKPANLFLARRPDGSPLVKVLDFGISKLSAPGTSGAAEAGVTTADSMMGSPRYMSPEQMRSAKDVDARTDVWALGIILQELLTARPVWEADSFAGLCGAIQSAAPPLLRSRRPDAPAALERVVSRCLAKDRRERLASVGDLAEALAPIAPARSRVSIERVKRIVAGQGLKPLSAAPTHKDIPKAPLLPENSVTDSAFGGTRRSGLAAPRNAFLAAVLLGVVAVTFGGGAALLVRSSLGGSSAGNPAPSAAFGANASPSPSPLPPPSAPAEVVVEAGAGHVVVPVRGGGPMPARLPARPAAAPDGSATPSASAVPETRQSGFLERK